MRIVALLLLISWLSWAQVNGAPRVGPGTVLVPGSQASADYSPAAAVQTATVALLPAGSSTPIPAKLTGIDAETVSFVVPPDVPFGDAILTVKPGDQATQWMTVSIVPARFSLFRRPLFAVNQNPQTAPVDALDFETDGTFTPNGLTTPAQPGETVSLWGTGLGATPQSAVQITLGGIAQKVLYAGQAPGQPGIDQINFTVAAGTPDGCYVPFTVTYGAQSVAATLSETSDGLPCKHPLGLSSGTMSVLDKGGWVSTGEITLSTNIEAASVDRASRAENASVQYSSYDASGIAAFANQPALPAEPCTMATPGTGGFAIEGSSVLSSVGVLRGASSASLRNGTASFAIPWTSPSVGDTPLANLPPAILGGGNWSWIDSTVTGPSFDFTLPPAVQIADGAPLTFDRGRNQTVTWNGAAFGATDTISLTLNARYSGAPTLTCLVPAQAGSVTLSTGLLARFAPGAAGSLALSASQRDLPHAELMQGNSPVILLVHWSSTDTRPVDFQ